MSKFLDQMRAKSAKELPEDVQRMIEEKVVKGTGESKSPLAAAVRKETEIQKRVDELTASLQGEVAELRKNAKFSLAIADLEFVRGRKRKLSAEEFGALKANLAANPLIEPIIVRRLENGKYELVAGHNRVAAYVELGRTHIDAINAAHDDRTTEDIAFYSNLLSPALPDYEKYVGLAGVRDRHMISSQGDLAAKTGLSRQWVNFLMAYDAFSDDVHAILRDDPRLLSANEARTIRGMYNKAKVTSFEALAEILKCVRSGDLKKGKIIEQIAQELAKATGSLPKVSRSSADDTRQLVFGDENQSLGTVRFKDYRTVSLEISDAIEVEDKEGFKKAIEESIAKAVSEVIAALNKPKT